MNTMQKFIQNISDLRIILTFSCVIVNFLPVTLIIDYLAIFGVLSLGILHGANDLQLLKSIQFMQTKAQRLLIYTTLVFVFSLILYQFPLFALTFFVLFSCYHFGEQQWHKPLQNKLPSAYLFYFFYGAFLFSVLFWSHAQQSQSIIAQLSSVEIPTFLFRYLSFGTLFFLLLFILVHFSSFKALLIDVFLQTFLLVVMFWTTNLVVSFSMYFVVWHSWPSLNDQVKTLYQSSNPLLLYLKDAWVFWLISLIGLVAFYMFNDTFGLNPLSLFFAFLSAITFPHVLVIFGLNQKSKPS
jgi:Brp/Blh family beta-carotene 15,15'-monooxygenase